jgi:hypothetical protein
MVLRYVKDMRTSHIAKRLKRQAATISRAIARAHQNLYDCVNARLAVKQQSCHDE